MSSNKNIVKKPKIQILRAAAIIAVVIIHTCPRNEMGMFVRIFVNFSVGMFIFLSGYLTKIDIKNIRVFYKKRILRVLIPYIIWSLIYTIVYNSYDNFVMNFFTARCCVIYYFIAVYIQLTLLAPFLFKFIYSKFWWVGLMVTPTAIIIEYILFFIGKPLEFPWNANNFMVWFIFYYIGVIFGNKIITYKISVRKTELLLIVSVILQLVEGSMWYKFGSYDMAVSQVKLSSMITTISVIFLSYLWINREQKVLENKYMKKISVFLIIIGDCSFGIYLSHLLVRGVLDKLFKNIRYVCFPLNSIGLILVTMSIILVVCKVCNKNIIRFFGLS